MALGVRGPPMYYLCENSLASATADAANQRPTDGNGKVLYRGPSVLDGSPIVVVLSCVRRPSRNGKTGDALQLWILRADMSPPEAHRRGLDQGVCGDCVHRSLASGGGGTCYVKVALAPAAVWRAWSAGRYAEGPLPDLTGRNVRLAKERARPRPSPRRGPTPTRRGAAGSSR